MAVVSIGVGWTPNPAPSTPTDITYGTINNFVGSGLATGGVISGYALSGGSTHVGGFWPMQAGLWSGTTDGTGQASITFPYAFANTPASVVATVEGSDYVVRIVSRATTGFTAKVLQVGVNWTSGAVLGSGLNIPTAAAVTSVTPNANSINNVRTFTNPYYAASASGGTAGSPFIAILSGGLVAVTVVNSITTGTDSFTQSGITTNPTAVAVSVSGFFAAVASGSVNIDWVAAA